jgi:hypothetical protein
VWGFQWIDQRTLIEEERLLDALFSANFRLRPRPGRKAVMDFGQLVLTDEVALK